MIVDSLHLELQDLYLQLQANCNDFLEEVQQLCEVTHVSAPRGPQRKKKTWNFEKKTLQMNIKEKFSDAIQVLKKEFQSRQKKGKLPTDATGLLKFWWEKNFNWPYPSVSFLEAVLFFQVYLTRVPASLFRMMGRSVSVKRQGFRRLKLTTGSSTSASGTGTRYTLWFQSTGAHEDKPLLLTPHL